MKLKILLIPLLISLSCCARREGPAEKLGRTLDELNSNVSEISTEWAKDHPVDDTYDKKREEIDRQDRFEESSDGLLDPR